MIASASRSRSNPKPSDSMRASSFSTPSLGGEDSISRDEE